jgi:uncharacterized protein YbbK (DUF523 family)
MGPRARVGVSACLIGRRVRYDGEHKRDDNVCDVLAQEVELVPVCPEVELGMGVPRDPVRLVRGAGVAAGAVAGAGVAVRMIAPRTGRDYTAEMTAWAEARAGALAAAGLSGYVLKQGSPSCGLAGVKLYAAADDLEPASYAGVGLFAAALRRRFPDMPIEQEGRLAEAGVCEAFIARVLAHARAQAGRT